MRLTYIWTCPWCKSQVVWFVRTDDQQDLDWLEHTLLTSEPVYYKQVVPNWYAFHAARMNGARVIYAVPDLKSHF